MESTVLELYNRKAYDEAVERARTHPDEIQEPDYESHHVGETVIHKAARHSSQYEILCQLLELNPTAAQVETERGGLLPLEDAAVNKNVRGFCKLHQVYPEGIRQVIPRGIHKGGTALHVHVCYYEFNEYAKKEKQFEILQLMLTGYPKALLIKNDLGETPLDIARDRHGESGEKANEFIRLLEKETNEVLAAETG